MFRSERPVFRRQSSAEQALQRANQRLKQKGNVHRDDSSDNEDDINNYLSSLRKKTSMGVEKQMKRVAIGDGASDISISDSSENTSMGRKKPQSKFLKSKPAASSTPVSSQSRFVAPKPSAIGADAIRRSAALAKASSLTGRFTRGTREPERAERSSSESQTSPDMLYAKSSRAKLNYLTDEESASIGRDGNKFLRKKEKESVAKPPAKKEERDGNLTPKTRKQLRFAGLSDDDDDENAKEFGAKSPKTPSSHSSSINSGRLRRSLTISDEDMSTAELGEGIISSSSGPDTPKKPALKSPSTPTSPKKRVTIAEIAQDVSEASDLSFLEDNIVERLGASSSSSSTSEEEVEELSDSEITSSHEEMIENVMDVDDLKSEDSSSSRPALEAIQTIDDLSSISAVSEDHVKSSPSSASSSTSTSATVIQSETRGVSQYDSDFEASEIVSEKTRPTAPTSTYSQDFESTTHSSTSRTDYSSESEEETMVTESYTKRVHHRRRRRNSRDEDKSVQTVDVGLSYQWHSTHAGQPYIGESLGMASVDLNPIAHYVVPPESLEGVTAYNPCVVALNNLLRQQLHMTQDFMATQRRLYDAMSRTILPEHSYTTLEETKKFIAKNRPPTISMDDALREVELEMNGP